MTEARPSNYWIASNALYITLNANGGPDYLLGNTASGAHILCYMKGIDGLEYDAGHNYRRWPLSLTPTHFETHTEKYVYCAIPRPGNAAEMAVIVFPSERLDIYGKNETGQQIGSEQYYYIWLQGIISSSGVTGANDRGWTQQIDTGTLASDEAIDAGGDQTWWRYSSIDDTVTFLKEIVMDARSVFYNLKARLLVLAGHELTGVATSETGYTDSDTLVATPGYVESQYLSKTHESEAQEQIGFLKGLWVGVRNLYEITANGIAKLKSVIAESVTATRIQTDSIISANYTGDGVADTGFRLTNSHNGHSKLTIDEIYVRMKAVFESLEVRERTYTGGDQIWSCAGNRITRVDYLGNVETADHVPQMMNVHADGRPSGQGQGDIYSVPVPGDTYGYSDVKVPWLLRQMPLLARAKVFARYRKVRIVINEPANNSANRAAASESPLANIRRARCYFLAKDDDMEVHNWWRINDLARCQTMNLANTTRQTYLSGEDEKAGNIFWWRKVIGVSYEPVTLDDGKQYHYFDVSFDYELEKSQPATMATSVMEGSDIPAAHDSVVQFGNTIIEGRMNLMMMEVNGSDAVGYNPTTDAPCLKAYRGVYCFDLNKCWVGGHTCKMKLSPKTGYEFYGPNFKQVTEYDVVPVPVERGLWTGITPTRDDYREHAMVRKCYYYDKVSHNGSYWLCSIVDGAHWVNGSGDYISDADYSALTEEQKALCSRKQNYTIEEPSANSIDWTEVVQKGDKGSFKSRVFCRTNSTPDTPQSNTPAGTTYNTYNNPVPPPVTGQPTWTDGIPQGTAILWSSVCTFYANGTNSGWSTPAPETDTADLDIEFSPSTSEPSVPQGNTPFADHSSEGWYNPSHLPVGQTMIWRAERKVKNGVYNGDWVITRIYGEKGNSITKSSEVAYYIKNTTGVRPVEDDPNWSTTKPTIGKGEWLFTKTVIRWSDNSTTVLYSAERNPNDGLPGQDIVAGTTVMTYALTQTNVQPADSAFGAYPSVLTQGWYLWSRAETPYYKDHVGGTSAGSSVVYNVNYVSENGTNGRSLKSHTEYYMADSSNTEKQVPTSTTGWSNNPNVNNWNETNKYLWNMEQMVYTESDGSETISYTKPHIAAIWTKNGKGIDSIVNYYQVGATAPSLPADIDTANPTLTGWSTSPSNPPAGQYLWNFERITWINSDGTYSYTHSNVHSEGYTGQNGNPGKDGWMVTADPANVIITQSLGTNTASFSSVMVGFTAKKGSVAATISSIDTPSSSQFNVAKGTGDNIKKVVVSSPQTHGNPAEYYTEGTFVVDVNVTDPDTNTTVTFSITVPCYANLLGTWKRSVEAGVETVVAGLTQYLEDDNGNIITSKSLREDINDATQDLSELSQTVTTQGQTIQNHNTRLSTAEGNISTIQRNAVTKNLLGRRKWTLNAANNPYADYDAPNDRWYDKDSVANDIYSQVVSLKAGKYCFYGYIPSTSSFSNNNIALQKGATASQPWGTASIQPSSCGEVSNDTITINSRTYHRCYAVFTLNEDSNCTINLWSSADESDIAVPCLCEGDTPSIETSMSMIRQTADEIEARVNDTGVNIQDKRIDLFADKVRFFKNKAQATSGDTAKIWIDGSDGSLHAVDGKFSGNIYTPYKRLTSSNIGEYETEDFYGDTVINLAKTGLNIQVEVSRDPETPTQAVHISLPKITADMLGCEVNILNVSGDVIEINGSGRAGQSSSGGYMTALVKPSVGLGTNTTLNLNAGYEAKLKAIHNPYMIQHENYQYSWLCCYANINP